MTLFLCKLWPYLAGGLIGWLLAGWLARRLKHAEPAVEKVIEKNIEVEKVIDNPEHLSLISKLEADNSQIPELLSKLAAFESAKPEVVEKVVEKVAEKEVDSPKLLTRIKNLEEENAQISGLKSKIKNYENAKPEIVEKVVEKEVDSPKLLARIKKLEEENAQISDLKSKIKDYENAKPEIVEKEVEKVFEKQVDNPSHLKEIAEHENRIKDMQQEPAIDSVVGKKLVLGGAKPTKVDIEAAKLAGFKIKQSEGLDDLTVIKGIGPKINDLIHNDGINTFTELASTRVEHIQKILEDAGSEFRLSKPGTWPAQADFSAANKWDRLKAWQDKLDVGEQL